MNLTGGSLSRKYHRIVAIPFPTTALLPAQKLNLSAITALIAPNRKKHRLPALMQLSKAADLLLRNTPKHGPSKRNLRLKLLKAVIRSRIQRYRRTVCPH